MPIFGSKRPTSGPSHPSTDPIAAFWHWWAAAGAAAADSAITDGDPGRVVEAISTRVAAIRPGLAWELAPGTSSRHQLVVTPEGVAERRAVARRWLRAAPPADDTWDYADARARGALDVTLEIAGVALDLREVAVQVERVQHHVDVAVHHPRLGDLPEGARTQVASLALDSALGESDVETWVGSIAVATLPPPSAIGLAGLRHEVDGLAAENVDEDGNPAWVVLRGDGPDGPVLASAQVPLRATSAPELDVHAEVRVPFLDRTDDGWPGPRSLDDLRRLEDHLDERLGSNGRLVAHETAAGVRTLHFYVDSTGPGPQVLHAAVGGWTQGPVTIEVRDDPAWDDVVHLRT